MALNKKAIIGAAAAMAMVAVSYQSEGFGVFANTNDDLSDCNNISLKSVSADGILLDANICRYDAHGKVVIEGGDLHVTKETIGIEPVRNLLGNDDAQLIGRLLSDLETLEEKYPQSRDNDVAGMKCEKSIDGIIVNMQEGYAQVNIETHRSYSQPNESGCKIQQHLIFGLDDVLNEDYKGELFGMDQDTILGLSDIEQDFGSAAAGKIQDLYYAAKAAATLVSVTPVAPSP